MREHVVQFFSEGILMKGTLYLPDVQAQGRPYPAIIPVSGYQGLNAIYPRLFASYFTERGYICLGFDYRGFGASGGPAGRVILDEQVEDIRSALAFLLSREEVDRERIGLLGWGMGASNVIRVAAREPSVKAIAALNGFFNGRRWLKQVLTEEQFAMMMVALKADRLTRALSGCSQSIDPFLYYPLDLDTSGHVDDHLVPVDGFGIAVTLELPESILELDAESVLPELSNTPLMVAHGKHNRLHPISESKSLREKARGEVEWLELDGKHNDFMIEDHPIFSILGERLEQFYSKALHIPVI